MGHHPQTSRAGTSYQAPQQSNNLSVMSEHPGKGVGTRDEHSYRDGMQISGVRTTSGMP